MLLDEPYFMKNKLWYEEDIKSGKLKLTKQAPQKAIQSYKEFYKQLEGNTTEDKTNLGIIDAKTASNIIKGT